MSEKLTIGKLAERAGVNVETIRYYQRRQLLEEPTRRDGGFRHYTTDTINRVRFIKRAQTLGFTLDEIDSLLLLNGQKACADTRALAARKVEIVEQKITDLMKMKRALSRLIRACDATQTGKPCPIIHVLADD